MKDWLRIRRLLTGIGREVGLAVCILHVVVSATVFLGPLLLAVGLRPLVDGAAARDAGRIAAGGALTGTALLMTVLAPIGYRWVTIRMRERSHMIVQRRLLTLSATVPGSEHFERPEFLDRLQLLKRHSEELADGMALAATGPLVVTQLAFIATLLGRLQPLLLLVPLIAVPAVWLSRRAETLRAAAELRTAADRRTAQDLFELTATPSSGTELRIHGLQQELVDRHERACHAQHRAMEAALLRSVAAGTAGWLLFAAAYLGAVMLVLREVARGEATAGDVALALALAAAVVGAAGRMSDLAGHAMRVRTVADHYHWLENRALSHADRGPMAPPDRLAEGIDLDGVGFVHPGRGSPALSGLSLRLPAGAVVAVVGENGAGKTTLVKLLCGTYTPTSGRILVDGNDLTGLDPDAYRARLTAMFQDFTRFELPVRESVGVGDLPRIEDAGAVRAALAAAGGTFAERLPDGLETRLGAAWKGGVELSGGQWQKLALARSAMRRRPLLAVLDEPTASLDAQTEHALFEQIAAEARRGRSDGRITLLVSHRFSTVRMADLILVLDNGRLAESGTHDELAAGNGLYAELYALQAASYR